ncbi:MAG: response regulator [Acidimicrobiales bacterium]
MRRLLAHHHFGGRLTRDGQMNTPQRDLLLVEDNPIFAAHVSRSLAASGHWKVTAADSLAAATAMLDEQPFEAVIVDLGLPDSDGPETFTTMRELVDEVPIIVMTNHEQADIGRALVRSGAADFLSKRDVTPDALEWSLDAAVERAEFRRDLHQHRIQRAIEIERRRIGRDLHDRVIQRLFAAGLELERSIVSNDPNVDESGLQSVRAALSTIDAAVGDLRFAIDQMHPTAEPNSFSHEFEAVSREIQHNTGRAIHLRMLGDVEQIGPVGGQAMLSVFREGVMNAVRHGVGPIDAEITAEETVRIVVRCAVGEQTTTPGGGRGLIGMADRAAELGGSCEFAVDDRASVLTWEVPCRTPQHA